MHTHERFLAAIIDDPDNDTPRLIYADWLDDLGEHERAELIRVQCALAPLLTPTGQVAGCYLGNCAVFLKTSNLVGCERCKAVFPLAEREKQLLRAMRQEPEGFQSANAVRWARPVCEAVGGWIGGYCKFVRGFIEEVTVPWDGQVIRGLENVTPLKSVTLTTWPRYGADWQNPSHLGGYCWLVDDQGNQIGQQLGWVGPACMEMTATRRAAAFIHDLLQAEFPRLTFNLPKSDPFGVGPDGGFLIPPEFRRDLFRVLYPDGSGAANNVTGFLTYLGTELYLPRCRAGRGDGLAGEGPGRRPGPPI